MKPDRLKELINEVISQLDVPPEDSIRVFETLVRVTLAYRDVLKSESGITLTVGDTREALNLLLEFVNYQTLSRTPNQRAMQLVRLWIDELNLEKESSQFESKVIH